VGEIWALAGGGGANTKIAAASAIARNNFIVSSDPLPWRAREHW
jgi:hypothetical protein